METKHTAIPYDCKSRYVGGSHVPLIANRPVVVIMAPTGDVAYVANYEGCLEKAKATANFIVLACNSHAELLAVANCATDLPDKRDPLFDAVCANLRVIAKAAVAKAT